jgi:hypothetical protein
MTELADLELWIRENMAEMDKEDDGKSVFFDGYTHAMYMVLKQIREMRKA